MIINDFLNRTLEIKDYPERIISLCPSITETLFYLGGEGRIVGVTRFCVHPAEIISGITKVGGTKNPNIEKIRELNPDLIICEKEENRKEDVEIMSNICPVFVANIDTFASSLIMIHFMGRLLSAKPEATKLISSIKRNFEELERLVSIKNYNPRVAYFIWKNPYMVAGNDTFINSILRKAGFHNIFQYKDARYPIIDPEELTRIKLDFLFLSSEPYPFQEKHIAEFQELIPGARIFLVDGEMFSWYGSRQLMSSEYMEKLIKNIES